jgi:predicted NBD/HSP70 family sugar kinase
VRLGIDIGGTKTAALVLDDTGEVVAHVASPSGRGNTQVLDTAVDVAHRAASFVGGWSQVDHVGACMPGLVDPDTGWARHAVNLAVTDLDLVGGLQAATGRRPAVDNDVKAAALGAHHALHPAVPGGTTAYLNVGTGLAAAIVHRGEVVRGAGGAAGEIGHIPVGTGIACSCGQQGCLETIASGTALHRLWPRPAGDLFPAAASGDERAQRVVATLARGIALAVQVLVVTGAELVVVGGGLARDGAGLERALAADVAERSEDSPFLRRLDLVSRIHLLDGDLPVAAIGAALLGGSRTAGARQVGTVL